jgi:hypothetical protein
MTLILATRAEDVVGFPALLNEMLWKANYSLRPEYTVYARGLGVGVVDYVATLHLSARMVAGSESHVFEASGTSVEMAIQEVAYEAMTRLRWEHQELWEDPFTYYPMQAPDDPVCRFATAPVWAPLLERRMVGLVSAYDWAYRSVKWELEETRRRLVRTQWELEPFVRSGKVRRRVVDGWPSETVQEEAPPTHRFPVAGGRRAVAMPMLNPISMGLHVRRFPRTSSTRESLLGAPVHLTHPENPEDDGTPGYHLRRSFEPLFARFPYQ